MRYLRRLHHTGIGCAYQRQPITLLIANKDIRILAEDGSLLRQLTLDPQPRLSAPGNPPRST